MKSIGTQIAIDMYNCSDLLLSDASGVQATVQSAAADFAMQPRETYVNCEDGINEYSVFAHCKQGQVTLHLYPDLGFVTIDVFTCFKDADPDGLARFLRHYFDPDKSKITYLERGDFGSESDMKPRRKSNIKTVRRARTIGNKLSKLIMKPRSM